MGGDGSLGRFIGEIEAVPELEHHVACFQYALLPYGTGNDTSQVFGWGEEEGDWGKTIETLVDAIFNSEVKNLTLWKVEVVGDTFMPPSDPNQQEEQISKKDLVTGDNLCSITMACYFNLGFDGEIGFDFERQRTQTRICNKVLYVIIAVLKAMIFF